MSQAKGPATFIFCQGIVFSVCTNKNRIVTPVVFIDVGEKLITVEYTFFFNKKTQVS